jgi:hypothetical protein
MPYVMVPVPEEHVEEVMRHMLNLVARANLVEWDEESVREFFLEADEMTRAVLSVVARGALSSKDVTDQIMADFLQLSVREVGSVLRELHESVTRQKRPPFFLASQVTEELPNGRVRDKRVYAMAPNIARLIRAAEKAEHAREEQRLSHGAG